MQLQSVLVLATFTAASTAQVVTPIEILEPTTSTNSRVFGGAVATDGHIAVVGAPGFSTGGSDGRAYLINPMTGAQIAELSCGGGSAEGDFFGVAVDTDGTNIIVGANRSRDFGGYAQIFNAANQRCLLTLQPSDPQNDDRFGSAVAISGNIAAVGAWRHLHNGNRIGAVYLFDTTTGAELAELLPDDPTLFSGFGTSLVIEGDNLIIGASSDDNGFGAVYVFDIPTRTKVHKFLGSTVPGAAGGFGHDVAAWNNTLVVGDQAGGFVEGFDNPGATNIFDLASGNFVRQIISPDAGFGYRFGASVAVNQDFIVVGSTEDTTDAPNRGAVHVFAREPASPFVRYVPDNSDYNFFGNDIALADSGLAVIGAQFTSRPNGDGKAFTAQLNLPDCLRADFNGDNLLDNGDIGAFITAFLASDFTADLNADGIVDNGDIGTFVAIFVAGCS